MNNFKILPKYSFINEIDIKILKKSAIIAHLFYDDKFNNSFEYLDGINENIDIYIVTASNSLEELAINRIKQLNKNNIKVLKKENRGRDFAALFVTCKEIINKYEYICFVHDKKSHNGDSLSLGSEWSKCLFENTIGSNAFVLNTINCFEKNKNIGILSAPIPPEEYLLGLRGMTWTCNEENAMKFLKKLGIATKINIHEDPYTIGSCFWFRKKAFDRIINSDLKYTDFPEEPMPIDGSLAHAIERCLCYISSYEAYDNFYLMNVEYSEYYMSMINDQLTKSISILRNEEILCFFDNKTSLDETMNLIKKKNNYSKLIKYCIHSRRIFVIEDDSDISEKCMIELRNRNIQIEDIYNINSINYKKISELPYRIVICVKDISLVNLEKLKTKFDIKPFIYE